MLAIAVSLLFALAAAAALAVIASSLTAAVRQAPRLVAELAEIDRRARLTRARQARSRSWSFPPALAAA